MQPQWMKQVSIGEFSEFVASSGLITQEQHGGMVYEAGWVVKPDWNWRSPYGAIGALNEPAVHVTYFEAEHANGKKNSNQGRVGRAGYTEKRVDPTDGYIKGKLIHTRRERSIGANCLSDCVLKRFLPIRKSILALF